MDAKDGVGLSVGAVIRFRYRGMYAFGRITEADGSYLWLGDYSAGEWPEGVTEAIDGFWKGDEFHGRHVVRRKAKGG